ncbi:hypothetical protein [Cupriavidus pinatubonensis]|uniref:Lipase helper protein n=1 Tax=Cupriavidus pinatubonensis TaxID=248026 RepID=A0ABN7YJK4_9BURK|nr:hypothetical protein [Cupriavidus pinatubonensis]CAG9173664.1 hypothetical protein LMG23994_02679 [Cupriavidus pinatubonensis]
MTAGEIRRTAIGPISESASRSMHRTWAVLGEAAGESATRRIRHDGAAADVTALLQDGELSASAREAIENLLRRHRLLEAELVRQRELLQEWILSQQTYKALYYQYSGQTPDAPRVELMRERDAVRRRLQEELHLGSDPLAVMDEPARSQSSS